MYFELLNLLKAKKKVVIKILRDHEIKGIENMTYQQLYADIEKGGKFVMFTYTISIVVMTFRRPINTIYYVKSDESTIKYGWSSLLISLFLGWWGIPFGPIYTIQSIIRAFTGKNITDDVVNHLEANRN